MPLVSLPLPPDLAKSARPRPPWAPWASARPGSVAAVLRELPLAARPGRDRPGGFPQQNQLFRHARKLTYVVPHVKGAISNPGNNI